MFDLSNLALLPEDSPQLATLPDLGSCIRSCLVGRQWSSSYVAHLLHGSLPCPRPAAKVPPPDRQSTAVALNLALATLLGLYPSCVKRPPFTVRAALYARVHSLLCSTAEAQAEFALKHQPLLSLAVAEYACFVLPSFMPAEHAALCAAHSVDAFFSAGPALFDSFRQDHVDSGSEPWSALSAAAHDAHERLTRVYRSKCRLPPQPRRPAPSDVPHSKLALALDAPRITPYPCHRASESLLRDEYAMLLGDPALAEAAALHSLVRIAPLPDNIRAMQEAALDAISQKCQRQARVRRTKHICLLCERGGRRGKPRLCSKTFRVVCQSCGDDAAGIPSIDMIGRVVTIQGRQLIFAPCCATVQEYQGSGRDLLPSQCTHCLTAAQQPGAAQRKPRPTCEVCDGQALPRCHEVLDHLQARMNANFLCHRHTPPEDWLRRCANQRQFDTACREWASKVRAAHRKG